VADVQLYRVQGRRSHESGLALVSAVVSCAGFEILIFAVTMREGILNMTLRDI